MGRTIDAAGIAERLNKVIDGCLLASMPHADKAPGGAQVSHRFLPINSATMRRGVVTGGYIDEWFPLDNHPFPRRVVRPRNSAG